MLKIKIIYDSYGIDKSEGIVVNNSLADEISAFHDINSILNCSDKGQNESVRTYIIRGRSCKHFRSYLDVSVGIEVVRVTPRSMLTDIFHEQLPDWLTNQKICEWTLLNREHPPSFVSNDWAATIAEWLIPGIASTSTLEQWLVVVASSENFPPNFNSREVSEWVCAKFRELLISNISSHEKIDTLVNELSKFKSPPEFATKWIKLTALLPVIIPNKVTRNASVSLSEVSPYERIIANELPLIFPMPRICHQDVSKVFREFIHNARLNDQHGFGEAVLDLNALWDGVSIELKNWLEINPRGMTSKIAEHLAALPGFHTDKIAQELVDAYRPPQSVPKWKGLDSDFESWVVSYANHLKGTFIRRDMLTSENDPSVDFSRWIKDHFTVCFDHPDLSYFSISKRIRRALSDGRTVIIALIDALAIHVVDIAMSHIEDHLKQKPSNVSFAFCPIPTITEVCKEAILTGTYPKQCTGQLLQNIKKAYKLSENELLVSANWSDAERVMVSSNTKLIVYRDNRLDDQLKTAGSYKDLLEDCPAVFRKVGKLVERWARDLYCYHQTNPLILLCSDHGFTYGPPSCLSSGNNSELNYRCIKTNSDNPSDISANKSLTHIDKDMYHLRYSYYAATGRGSNTDTISGWQLLHGGLLPEEVIIPIVEWCGAERAVRWPEVTIHPDVTYEQRTWLLKIHIYNKNSMQNYSGELLINLASDESANATITIPTLEPGHSKNCEACIRDNRENVSELQDITISLRLRDPVSNEIHTKRMSQKIKKTIQLVERTQEVDDFENMF